MADPQSPRDILGRTMVEGRAVLVPKLAEMLQRRGIREIDSSEQRRRFYQRALTDEQEASLWRQEMQARGLTELMPGSPEALDIGLAISKQVYPDRWDMLEGEGREHGSDQAAWAAEMARKGPPRPKVEEEPLVPTEPMEPVLPAAGEGY